MPGERPPRGAGKAAALVVGAVCIMVVAIFVGLNLNHADTLRDEQAGKIERRDAPATPSDLQHVPQR